MAGNSNLITRRQKSTDINSCIYHSIEDVERSLELCTVLKLVQNEKSYARNKSPNFQTFQFFSFCAKKIYLGYRPKVPQKESLNAGLFNGIIKMGGPVRRGVTSLPRSWSIPNFPKKRVSGKLAKCKRNQCFYISFDWKRQGHAEDAVSYFIDA